MRGNTLVVRLLRKEFKVKREALFKKKKPENSKLAFHTKAKVCCSGVERRAHLFSSHQDSTQVCYANEE